MRHVLPFYVLLLSLVLLGLPRNSWGQVELNKERLQSMAEEAASQWERDRAEVEAFARERGLTIRKELDDGRVIELMRIENGRPVYNITHNREGAVTSSVDEVRPGGALGLSLTGDSETLGVWDGGAVRASHQEFGSRVTQQDGATSLSNHATHVGGTMIASGADSDAQGMAFEAGLDAYDWGNDQSEMATAASNGLRVSNHSYGRISGWRGSGSTWIWYGDITISETEDYQFGFYGDLAQGYDNLVYNAPRYVIVKAAGNDRNDVPSSQPIEHEVYDPSVGAWVTSTTVRDPDGGTNGYESLGRRATAKNILTVGAVEGISGGYTDPSDVIMSSFSGWGPTDDGRLKPDLVAKGVSVYSSLAGFDTDYGTYNGTSMASPMVSGSVSLLQEHYRDLHGTGYPLSSTVKALLLHTADEAGNSGPDYVFGWGLMNVARAAEVISTDAAQGGRLQEHALSQDEVVEYTVSSDGTVPLTTTLAWTDPEGTPPDPQLNPRDRMLVNDLDLRIEGPDGSQHQPYVLDPSAPVDAAQTGDNVRDNVEQVLIADPATGEYVIRISHKGSLADGRQAFSMVMTGASPVGETLPPVPPIGITADAPAEEVDLAWDPNPESDIAGYNLYRSTESFSDPTDASQVNDGLVAGFEYTDTSVETDQLYHYRAMAVDEDGDQSPLSPEVAAVVQPSVVSASVSRSFGEVSGVKQYGLVALPGAANRPLSEVVEGDAGSDWEAYWDDGTDMVQYDGSDTFQFEKGRGFWLTSRQDWTVEENIGVARLQDSTVTVPLNEGWTIVANPFSQAVSWTALRAFNGDDLRPLWPYGGAFNDTSDVFESAKTGRAYYLFNDNPNRDSLEIPHPVFTAGKTAALDGQQKETKTPTLRISARPDGSTHSPSTVQIGLAERDDAEEHLIGPPNDFEPVSLRIRPQDSTGGSSTPSESLLRTQRHITGEGDMFDLQLTNRTGKRVALQWEGADAMNGRSGAVLDPEDERSYRLREGNTIEVRSEDKEKRLKVAIGTNSYVETEEEKVLPDEVRLTSYPNPVRRRGTLEYAVPEQTDVSLRIYDVLGRQVATLATGTKRAGRYLVQVDAERLSSGMYFGRLTTPGRAITQKIMIVK